MGWPTAKKSLLTSGVVLCLVLYSTFLLHLARGHLDRLPFIDPAILNLQIQLSYFTLAAWLVMGLISFFASERHAEARLFKYGPIQVYAITNSFYAYLFGYFTDPYGFVTLIGGIMVGLPLFGGFATRAGLISWLSIFGVLVFLEQIGEIPYGPLYQSSPIIDGHLSLPWAVGIGSINVTGGLLAAVFSFSIFSELHKRDRLLRRNQSELLGAVKELSEATRELEDGRRELELRVEERTLELKVSNRNLQFEIEKREATATELGDIRSAMEAAVEGVAHVGADGNILSANQAFLQMHSAEAAGMLGSQANSWVAPRDRPKIIKAILELGLGEKAEVEVQGLGSDRKNFSQVVALVRISGGKPGEHYRFARDVTQQNKLSEQLNQATKMEAIGRLAGGIAHDFNNLLMAILAAGERLEDLFRRSSEEDGEGLEMANMVTMAGTRAAALTSQLLDFAHVQPPSMSTLDINQSVRNVLELLAPALGESINVETDLCEGRLFSLGDAARFDSGLLNVALNAKDAMADGGRLSVMTREVISDSLESGAESSEPEKRRQVRIDLIDTGIGMDSATAAQILDPFFTTKPTGKGTGLGLSVFSTYIREIGGALKISSEPGQGTHVAIYIPLVELTESPEKEFVTQSADGGGKTILLAEDEDIVARATTMLLTHGGYQVIRCATGLEAVNIYKERGSEIDLVLLDYRMPEMTGSEAFRELTRIDPSARVILMSGNLSRPEFADLKSEGLQSILRKPCSMEDLTLAIREALEVPGPEA